MQITALELNVMFLFGGFIQHKIVKKLSSCFFNTNDHLFSLFYLRLNSSVPKQVANVLLVNKRIFTSLSIRI